MKMDEFGYIERKTLPEGRLCSECGQKLGIYNKGPNCYAHTEGMSNFKYVPITKCTSYKAPFGNDGGHGGYGFVKPGSEKYNDMAFRRELIENFDMGKKGNREVEC